MALTVDMWPCGKSPASGESYEIYSPFVYTIANVNNIRPYIDIGNLFSISFCRN